VARKAKAPEKATRKKTTGAARKTSPRTARRKQTAKQVAKGTPVSQIAKSTGVSRATAYRDAASPECRFEIARLLDKSSKQLEKLVSRMLICIDQAFDADRVFILKIPEEPDEIAVSDLPDHQMRLKAVAQLQRLLILGRPAPRRDSGEDRPITLEQFESLLQTYLRNPHSGKPK
jgi:AcrR family transcriptional regulator